MSLFVSVHDGAGHDRVPLVLLHGFGGSHQVWDVVLPELDPATPLLVFDLPGHGRSLAAEGKGGAGRMAKAIHQALEERGLQAWHLAGHSMGGAVAALVALRAPQKARSLTLIAPGGMTPSINSGLLARFAAVTGKDELADVLIGLAAPDEGPDGQSLDRIHRQRMQDGAIEALQATYAAMFPEGPENGQGVIPHDQLARLALPVEVLWGSDDQVLPCPAPDQLPQTFRLTVLAERGHMLPEAAPAETAALLNRQSRHAGTL